jgi:hypothetical protein
MKTKLIIILKLNKKCKQIISLDWNRIIERGRGLYSSSVPKIVE